MLQVSIVTFYVLELERWKISCKKILHFNRSGEVCINDVTQILTDVTHHNVLTVFLLPSQSTWPHPSAIIWRHLGMASKKQEQWELPLVVVRPKLDAKNQIVKEKEIFLKKEFCNFFAMHFHSILCFCWWEAANLLTFFNSLLFIQFLFSLLKILQNIIWDT